MEFITPYNLHRNDVLTGCGNVLGFLECLSGQAVQLAESDRSLIAIDINSFALFNLTHGHARGDDVLRWVRLVLVNETPAPTFRTGGDEFSIVLLEGAAADHSTLAERIFERLNREAGRVGLSQPAATVAVVHFNPRQLLSPVEAVTSLYSALAEVKQKKGSAIGTFRATDIAVQPGARRLLEDWITKMVDLGALLDESQRLAFTDPVTGLPNQRAALQWLESAVLQCAASGQPLAILLIDGDNLKRFNEHGYAMGDKMIQDLGATLRDRLRPGDFIARWRMGDEFIVLLPGTSVTAAKAVAERLRQAVSYASQGWLYNVTISTGLAAYPAHGSTVEELLQRAEAANMQAKSLGKDRVTTADIK
jgi:diguanylate cyclase (GGDEF)-like protein